MDVIFADKPAEREYFIDQARMRAIPLIALRANAITYSFLFRSEVRKTRTILFE